MTWIEGVGDEVTIFFGIAIIVLVISLAWLSTGIRDIPLIGVIIIELTTRRRRVSQTDSQDTPTVQTSDGSTAETNSSISDISQTEDVSTEQETYGVQGHQVQVDHEGKKLHEESDDMAGEHDNINLKEVKNGQSDSRNISNKVIEHRGDAVEDSTVAHESVVEKAESQENKEKLLKTELSDTELRHRRMTFFEKANKLGNNECGSVDLSFRDNKATNNSQTTFPDNISVLPADFGKDSLESDFNIDKPANGAEPVISNTVFPGVIANSDMPVRENEGLDLQSERGAERLSSNQESANAARPDESTEENMINSDSNMIRIRLKYFNDRQRLVSASPKDTVDNFRRTHFSVELSENKLIRFIFNGQELRINSSTLESYNIMDNSVVHCLISQNPSQNETVHASDDDFGFDMGVFMFPLFGFILAVIWYFRFTYRQFFNVTSTLSLGGITFLFVAALCASFRRHHGHEHLE